MNDINGDSTRYEIKQKIGKGGFSYVFKALDTQTKKIVAVKQVKLGSKEDTCKGVHITALREIKLLREVKHENVINLIDIFGHKSSISLVYEFMDTDLEVIIKHKSIVLTQSHIKAYMIMILKAVSYLHSMLILHRDLKPNNLLVSKEGVLKVCDFGMATYCESPNRKYTSQVVTRWYRCPELLYGATSYGSNVDMWAIGCILAELLLRIPFLPGDSDITQLTMIFTKLGTPTEEDWPGMEELPHYLELQPSKPEAPLSEIFVGVPDDLLKLISDLFTFNPLKRIKATQALDSSYFSNAPPPTLPCDLPMPCKDDTGRERKVHLFGKRGDGRPLVKKKLQF